MSLRAKAGLLERVGGYDVLLLVRDNEGGIATATTRITVAADGDPFCGDGAVSGDEVCDDTDFSGANCATEGFVAGELNCAAGCTSIDTSGCSSCGNAVIDSPEACDGAALAAATCESRGFTGGELGCTSTCVYDVSGCLGEPVIECGDGVVAGAEICDGVELAGQTCLTLGFDGGELTCATDCGAFDNSACTTGGADVGMDAGGADAGMDADTPDSGPDAQPDGGEPDAGSSPDGSSNNDVPAQNGGGQGDADSGCGCAISGQPVGFRAGLWVVLGALFVALRRRRS